MRPRNPTCPHGHPYVGDNLYVRPGTNERTCKACRAARNRRRYHDDPLYRAAKKAYSRGYNAALRRCA